MQSTTLAEADTPSPLAAKDPHKVRAPTFTWRYNMSDITITISGDRGAGKTTVAHAIARALQTAGINVWLAPEEQRVSWTPANVAQRLTKLAKHMDSEDAVVRIQIQQLPRQSEEPADTKEMDPLDEVVLPAMTLREAIAKTISNPDRKHQTLHSSDVDTYQVQHIVHIHVPMVQAKRVMLGILREDYDLLKSQLGIRVGSKS